MTPSFKVDYIMELMRQGIISTEDGRRLLFKESHKFCSAPPKDSWLYKALPLVGYIFFYDEEELEEKR